MLACCVFDASKILSVLQNVTDFIWDRWRHLMMCLHLMEPHGLRIVRQLMVFVYVTTYEYFDQTFYTMGSFNLQSLLLNPYH